MWNSEPNVVQIACSKTAVLQDHNSPESTRNRNSSRSDAECSSSIFWCTSIALKFHRRDRLQGYKNGDYGSLMSDAMLNRIPRDLSHLLTSSSCHFFNSSRPAHKSGNPTAKRNGVSPFLVSSSRTASLISGFKSLSAEANSSLGGPRKFWRTKSSSRRTPASFWALPQLAASSARSLSWGRVGDRARRLSRRQPKLGSMLHREQCLEVRKKAKRMQEVRMQPDNS